jgi:hypothetical protein
MYDVRVYADEFDMQYYMVSSQFRITGCGGLVISAAQKLSRHIWNEHKLYMSQF